MRVICNIDINAAISITLKPRSKKNRLAYGETSPTYVKYKKKKDPKAQRSEGVIYEPINRGMRLVERLE